MPSASLPAISLRSLGKSYGSIRAVDGVSLDVHQGEVLGFLGLNGAGKTTTIRILLDFLRPTEGSAAVLGIDCQRDSRRTRALIGYLPGELGLQAEMTGAQLLRLASRLGPAPVHSAYQRKIADRLELSPADLRRPVREYSTGMKRKLGLVQALQGDAPIVILDEPTEGLDPLVQRALYELLFELRAKGRTIFMSSHVLSHVERLCDRVAVIRKGAIVLVATMDDLRRRGLRVVRVRFAAPVDAVALPASMHVIERSPMQWVLRVEGPVGELMPLIGGLPVHDVEVTEPALEDTLHGYYRQDGT